MQQKGVEKEAAGGPDPALRAAMRKALCIVAHIAFKEEDDE